MQGAGRSVSPAAQHIPKLLHPAVLQPRRPVHRSVSSRRQKTGQLVCYLIRTTRLLPTPSDSAVDVPSRLNYKPPEPSGRAAARLFFCAPRVTLRGRSTEWKRAPWPIPPRPRRRRARSPAAPLSTKSGARASAAMYARSRKPWPVATRRAAEAAFNAAQPELMRAATKGVLHKNTASRKVSRLAQRVKGLSA